MINLDSIRNKFLNLGVFSRILLVIIKPLALWLSIRLDSDAGLAIAQIYLIGLLFISLLGTNAHRPFYQKYFGGNERSYTVDVIRTYILYIQKITLQLIFVILISITVAAIAFSGTIDVVLLGILFGIAEKINDEYQRYSQFIDSSKNLFILALSKLIPVLVATILSYINIVDIKFAFPILLLVGSVAIVYKSFISTFRIIINNLSKSFFINFKMSVEYIRQDIVQIGCVFMGMSLISLDKWLLQYFSKADLPTYMLYTQIASIFIVIQTIILIAPVRSRLVNENPQDITAIKIGSPVISLLPLLIGFVLYLNNDLMGNNGGQISYFAFFFASIVTFSVAYVERLYWATSSGVRLTLDSSIVVSFLISIVLLSIFWPHDYFMILCMAILFCFMCLRLVLIMYILDKTKRNNT